MAWTGRHNSNSACAHSQTSLEFDNLTVTRKFPMWLVSTAASRSKVGNEAVQSQLPALPATKNRKVGANAGILGKRQGLQRPFECGVLGAFCRLCRK